MTKLPPIRRQVVVNGTPEAAFEVFTGEIGDWWPLGNHSVYGNGSTVAVRDGRVVERGPDGQESSWGAILDWEPPSRFRMTWHPGSDPANASEILGASTPLVGRSRRARPPLIGRYIRSPKPFGCGRTRPRAT